MNCDDVRPMIDALIDRELTLESSLIIERHLLSCGECSIAYENTRKLRNAMSTGSFYAKAPDYLSSKIVKSIRQSSNVVPEPNRNFFVSKRAIGIWSAAATLIVVGLLSLPFIVTNASRPVSEDISDQVFTSSMRSLMEASHGVDIVSSNQHTVKPWFAGKLDFSPPVKDFSSDDFPLIGGRRDYLDGRNVAALVYRRRQHWINVYIWPSNSDESLLDQSYQGYNIIHWSQSGMTYWMTSDLNAPELGQLAQLIRSEK